MKKIIVLVVVFLSWHNISFASLDIVEVMYDPEGSDINREWVKLYNNGEEEVKIIGGQTKSAWRISGGETKESLHYINEDLNIPSGSYAIITKNKDIFKNEYPSFSGNVTTASISFNNTSGLIKIWDGKEPRNIVASYEYVANDKTEEESESNSSVDSDDSSYSSSSGQSVIYKNKEEPKILKVTTKIISPKVVVSGIPFSISSLTTTNTGKTYNVGKFVWNFGDGMEMEVREYGPFEYTYNYPGDYILSLSYFDNSFVKIADSTDKITIKVIPSDIYISSIGNDIDPYIEIENKSKYEIDLSMWSIIGNTKVFNFPNGTKILSGKKIKLSPKITNFNGEDIKYVMIKNPNNEVVSIYPIRKINSLKKSIVSKKNNTSVLEDIKEDNSSVINLNNLEANASNPNNNLQNPLYAFIGLFLIIGLGIISFLFIKKKNKTKDYIDGEIRAEDMTIVE